MEAVGPPAPVISSIAVRTSWTVPVLMLMTPPVASVLVTAVVLKVMVLPSIVSVSAAVNAVERASTDVLPPESLVAAVVVVAVC